MSHKVTVAKVSTAWQATCTCGWAGALHFVSGARMGASSDRWQHLEVIDGRERGEVNGNAERMWGKTHALDTAAITPAP